MADIEGLELFIEKSESNRDFALFFSGREDVLGNLTRRANLAKRFLDDEGFPPSGMTTVVQGCPGIGKTSLMHRFVQLCNEDIESKNANGMMPLPFVLNPSEAIHSQSIIEKVLQPEYTNQKMKWLSSIAKDVSDRLKLNATFDNLLDVIRSKIGTRPVVILVDEIQNIGEKNREFISDLHMGVGEGRLAVLPIFFGLNNSEARLQSLGLSRLGDKAIVNLGLLTPDDCKQSFFAMLDEYRVDRSNFTDEWVETMVKDSQCFPHHLTAALRSTATVLIENQGILTSEGLARARELANTSRQEFYAARVGLLAELPVEVVVEVARTLQARPSFFGNHPSLANRRMQEVLTDAGYEDTTLGRAREITDLMIHRGILQMDHETKTYTIPIPSFQKWAVETLGMDVSRHSPGFRRD